MSRESSTRGTPETGSGDEGDRLQKVMSQAGVSSRREAEQMIAQGRVLVNGRPARIGERVVPSRDRIELDGRPLRLVEDEMIYLMLNKPEGVITTSKDPQHRRTVLDLLAQDEKVWPVGRLDAATDGLLILTNDGELTHRLTHPKFEVEKTYVAEVRGNVGQRELRKLTTGVDIGEGRPAVAVGAKLLAAKRAGTTGSVVEIVVHEGRKRVVRRMFEGIGHPVMRLTRVAIGPLKLGRLAQGTYRTLTRREIEDLMQSAGL